MTLTIFPAVVWALDDPAETAARNWYSKVDSQTRHFLRLARSQDDLRTVVQNYASEDYGLTLPRLGIARPVGTRIRVVLVGSCMGPEAVGDWAPAESYLDALEREVLSLERVRITIAHHGAVRPGERQVKLDGTRGACWLLSTRLHTTESISLDKCQALLGRLLYGLLLAEPRPVADAPTVWDSGQPGQVRLLGYPERDPEEILDRVVDAEATAVLFHARALSDERFAPEAADRQRLLLAATKVGDGRYQAEQGLRAVLGSSGIGTWSLHQLLAYAPDDLRRVVHRISAEAGEMRAPQSGPPLWRRLVEWIRRSLFGRLSRKQSDDAPADNRNDEEVGHFRARVELARDLLTKLSEEAGTSGPSMPVPEDLERTWRERLQQSVQSQLRCLAGEVGGTPRTADAVVTELRKVVRGDIAPLMFQAEFAERTADPGVREAITQLVSGEAFRFSGCLVGGQRPMSAAVACSASVCLRFPGVQSYSYWPAAGLVLFTASEPVNPTQLAW